MTQNDVLLAGGLLVMWIAIFVGSYLIARMITSFERKRVIREILIQRRAAHDGQIKRERE